MHWRRDLKINSDKSTLLQAVVSYFTSPSFKAVTRYRIYRWLYQRGPLGKALHKPFWLANCKMGCYISPKCEIGHALYLPHPVGIVIGEGVVIGDEVTIFQNVTLGVGRQGGADYPRLGNGVVAYTGAVLIGGIEVGDGAKIGAHTLVRENIPPGATVVASPAVVLPKRNKRVRSNATEPMLPSAPQKGDHPIVPDGISDRLLSKRSELAV